MKTTQTKTSTQKNFWAGKRVIVTGGAGFLGSFLVEKLRKKGAGEIIVPRSSRYDLCAVEAIRDLLNDTRGERGRPVDMVIHLAAKVGGIGANRAHPADFFYANLMMGVQLLHESYLAGVKKFVAVGTICAYPKFTPVPFKEDDLWSGYPEETNAPYGLAKKMMLIQSQTYREQYGYNSIYLLPVNLYGPRDNFDLQSSHVIPAMIRKCVDARDAGKKSITLWGDGSPSREFLYVEDAAEGLALAAENYNRSLPVNLGSGSEITIKDLAALIVRETGYQGAVKWDAAQPNGQPRRCLDVSRAEKFFGFKAKTKFAAGLKKTIAWYEKNKSSLR